MKFIEEVNAGYFIKECIGDDCINLSLDRFSQEWFIECAEEEQSDIWAKNEDLEYEKEKLEKLDCDVSRLDSEISENNDEMASWQEDIDRYEENLKVLNEKLKKYPKEKVDFFNALFNELLCNVVKGRVFEDDMRRVVECEKKRRKYGAVNFNLEVYQKIVEEISTFTYGFLTEDRRLLTA